MMTKANKIRATILVVFSFLASLGAASSRAQSAPPTQITPSNETGTNPFGTYSTDAGNVNLTNGNLSLSLPIISLPGRNGLNYTLAVQYDSKIWTPSARYASPTDIVYQWKSEQRRWSVGDLGWRFSFPGVDPGGSDVDQFGNYLGLDGSTLTLADGSKHYLSGRAPVIDAEDGSGITAFNDSNHNLVTATLKDGTVLFGSGKTYEDTNGNYISSSDTLGRQITFTYTTNRVTSIAFKDSNGTTQTVTLNYASIPLFQTSGPYQTSQPPFTYPKPKNCQAGGICHSNIYVNQPSVASATLLTSVVLPDGTQYTFSYNGYGELTKFTFPTGGYAAYEYAAFPHLETFWVATGFDVRGDFREVTKRHICRDPSGTCGGSGTPEDITTFTPTISVTTLQPNNAAEDVVDPLGYKNHYEFSQSDPLASGPSWPRETLHSVYSETGTLLRTTQTTYVYQDYCTCPLFPKDVTTTLSDTGGSTLVTKTHYDYDTYSATVMYPPYDPANGVDYENQSPTVRSEPIDNPTQVLEYNYGSGAPGTTVVRKTVNTWLKVNAANSNVDYSTHSVHIWNRKATTQTWDGGTTKFAETDFEYDNYSVNPLTASGAVQRDSAYNTASKTRGNLTAIKRWRNTDSAFLTTQFAYDDAGNATKAIDPLSHTTLMSYADSWGNNGCLPSGGNAAAYLTSVADALNHLTSATYNSCTGTMASITDQNGQVTGFPIYDLMGRLLQTTLPDGGQVDRTFSTSSTPFSLTTVKKLDASRNLESELFVDGLARATQTILCEDGTSCANKIKSDTTYDPVGRTSTVSNPYRTTSDQTYGITTSNYDALNRTTKVIPPDGSTSANNTSTVYAGNCVTVTDQAGKIRKSCSDALGRLIQVFEPNASNSLVNETDYQYDPLNNLLRVDQKGNTTDTTQWRTRLFTYNSLSQLLTANNPESGTLTYTYFDDGTLHTKLDARSITTTYAYDAVHRLTGKTYSNGDPAISYSYDQTACLGQPACYNIGHRTSMTDAAGSEAWSYDKLGQTLTDQRTTNGVTKSAVHAYDLAGNLISLTNPSGRVITYAYDTAARALSAIDSTGPINYATNAVYAPQGALAGVKNGASLYSTFLFNNRLQPCWLYATTAATGAPTGCTQTGVGNANILDYQYDFGLGVADNGNVNKTTNRITPGRSLTYTYDELNRVKEALTDGTTGSTCWGQLFGTMNGSTFVSGYDIWGNLSTISADPARPGCGVNVLSQSANTKNQIVGDCYDLAGNLLGLSAPPCPSPTYSYNAENQLTLTAGVTYTYDGDGKRVKKSSGTLYWYGAGSDPLDETDLAGSAANAAFKEYIFFDGKRIARRDYQNNVNYYFADHLGTARAVTNAAGTMLDDSDFYPFGGERVVVSSSGNTYKFTGKERDAESGLDNFGARYDSSSIGRFMSPDWSSAPTGVPYADFGDPQSLNLYSYAKNRPTTYVDRDGHCGEPLSFVICVAIGVAAVAYGVHELHEWQKEREKAENEAFQKSLGCTASNAQCTESEIRAYDKERLNTYGEGAIKGIENTVPDATPPTTITGVVVDQAKGKAIDAMVDSAKKKDDKHGPNQPNQPGQPNPNPNPNQQPSNTPSTPPPPPRPQPPPPPPCTLDKEKKC